MLSSKLLKIKKSQNCAKQAKINKAMKLLEQYVNFFQSRQQKY